MAIGMPNFNQAFMNPMFMGGLSMLLGGLSGRRQQTPLADLSAGLGIASTMQGMQRQQALYRMQQEQLEAQQRKADMDAKAMQDLFSTDPKTREQAMAYLAPGAYIKSQLPETTKPTPAMVEAAALPALPPEQAEYVRQARMKPSVQVQVGMMKPGELKQYQHKVTGKPPPADVTPQELLSGEYEIVTSKPTSEAGRVAMVRQGYSRIDDIRKEIINEDGTIDRKALASMYVPGSKIRSYFEEVVSNAVYLKTGAAATASEVQQQLDIYQPRVWSDAGTANSMLDRLKEFFEISAGQAGVPSKALEPRKVQPTPTPGMPFTPPVPAPATGEWLTAPSGARYRMVQ